MGDGEMDDLGEFAVATIGLATPVDFGSSIVSSNIVLSDKVGSINWTADRIGLFIIDDTSVTIIELDQDIRLLFGDVVFGWIEFKGYVDRLIDFECRCDLSSQGSIGLLINTTGRLGTGNNY